MHVGANMLKKKHVNNCQIVWANPSLGGTIRNHLNKIQGKVNPIQFNLIFFKL
jgi:hypothetical protein